MAHDHAHHHGHHHFDPGAGDRKVALAVAVNLLLTLAQIVGGLLSGSVALIADAIHNLSDAISLGIAFVARKIGRRPTDADMTFGYARAEIVAALINYTTLIVIGLYLIYEAAVRLADPPGIDGWLVVVVAGVALLVDLVTALLTFRLSRESVNIRAAFLHNVADALGSVAVIVAGTLIILYDWRLVDPLVTLGIAGYILWMAFSEIGGVIRMLMLGSPPGIEPATVIKAMESCEGVLGVHHLHLWQISERAISLEAHVVVKSISWPECGALKTRLRALLDTEFGVRHVTLDMEDAADACVDAGQIGGSVVTGTGSEI